MVVVNIDSGNRESYVFGKGGVGKRCYLRRDKYVASDGNLYPVFIIHGVSDFTDLIWYRWINFRIEEVDGHFIVYRENKTIARGGEVTDFKNLSVKHDEQGAENYALEEARKMAGGLADTIGVELKDYTLEEAVEI